MLTPREAESDFKKDQLDAIRTYFTLQLRRGERSIPDVVRYYTYGQGPLIAADDENILVVIQECRSAGWDVELKNGKWEFQAAVSKGQE